MDYLFNTNLYHWIWKEKLLLITFLIYDWIWIYIYLYICEFCIIVYKSLQDVRSISLIQHWTNFQMILSKTVYQLLSDLFVMPSPLGAGGIMFSGCLSFRLSVWSLQCPFSTCTWVSWSIQPTVTVLRHARPFVPRGFRAFAGECLEVTA